MLRTDTKDLSEFIHIIKYAHVENLCTALGCLNQPGEHGNRGGLSSPVVAQKREYLAVVHGYVRVLNSDLGAELPP